MSNFSARLRELRTAKHLTQKQLAEAIGASERGIQQYELGERKPTYDMLITLANYFEISIDELIDRDISPIEANSIQEFIGLNVKALRKANGLTQEKLAELSGINSVILSKLERGEIDPTLGTICKLSDALHVNPSELVKYFE